MVRIGGFEQLQPVNLDSARLQFDGLAVARQVVGALAVDLDGRKTRRNLLDRAGKTRQLGAYCRRVRPDRARCRNAAFGVVGVAFLAPADGKAIGLTAVE